MTFVGTDKLEGCWVSPAFFNSAEYLQSVWRVSVKEGGLRSPMRKQVVKRIGCIHDEMSVERLLRPLFGGSASGPIANIAPFFTIAMFFKVKLL